MINNLLLAQTTTSDPVYVEDVFSTYLYTGTGSTQTITNDIDLAGKGGLVWLKARTQGAGSYYDNVYYDTARGKQKALASSGPLLNYGNSDNSAGSSTADLYQFTSTGFSLGADLTFYKNASGYLFSSWTFRKSARFFDVVTWTGNGANRSITHALGQVPGMILVKRTDNAATSDWFVYHRSISNTEYLSLNQNYAKATLTSAWNSTTATSTSFSVGTDSAVNASGATYVAYVFAHDEASDGIIQCGAYTGNGSASGPSITLGWEPQYVLIKMASSTGNWQVFDTMRGIFAGGADSSLAPNSGAAESTTNGDLIDLTATGFTIRSTNALVNTNTGTYVYMAIRRGPMRTPTDATKVFNTLAYSADGVAGRKLSLGFAPDVVLVNPRTTYPDRRRLDTRLTANNSSGYSYAFLLPYGTYSEGASSYGGANTGYNEINFASDTGTIAVQATGWGGYNNTTQTGGMSLQAFRRAPGFFDVVCYTGTGSATTVSHNLGVAPELIITKGRSGTGSGMSWGTYVAPLGSGKYFNLNDGQEAYANTTVWNNTTPTASVFSIGTAGVANTSGMNYVCYLFASCPGVSKVGSYTGNGSSQNIDCGFTNGARFVLIKRADAAGDWYVWDTARGIVSANDPHLSLNTTASEVTTDDSIDPLSTGFTVNQVTATNVNVSSATYIYLAIA